MNFKNIKSFCILSLLPFFLAVSYAETLSKHVIYSPLLKKEFKNQLNQDLDFLYSAQFGAYLSSPKSNPMFSKFFEQDSPMVTGADISEWIKKRAHFVIAQGDEKFLMSAKENVKYPNSKAKAYSQEWNNGFSAEVKIPEKKDFVPSKKSNVAMTNIGAFLYMDGKINKNLNAIMLPKSNTASEFVSYPITSPRAGIFMMGEGLFNPELSPNDQKVFSSNVANSIFRLSILIHESHHSDGNGRSLCFPHIVCPKGHSMEGRLACDYPVNGPYFYSFVFSTAMKNVYGKDLSYVERSILLLIDMDAASRLVPNDGNPSIPSFWDDEPEMLKEGVIN